MNMKKVILLVLLVSLFAAAGYGQTTFFGKNKVQYRTFDWQYLQTRHFDIYFHDQLYESAKFSAAVLESSYVVVSEQLSYKVHKRIPVFIYASPNDFQQTNIVSGLIGEGVGGFTESAKNRIVVPFNGSYYDFRHVLHHELTHAVTYDMLLGNLFTSLLSRRRLFNLPLWFAEGFAEYSSRSRWHYRTDMIVRDATINGYLAPPEYIYGGMEYYEGTAMINFIVDNYGGEKLGEILQKGKIHLTMNKALKAAVGIEYKEFWEKFSKEMKRRYWPEISKRDDAKEIARELTDHEEDSSNRNEKPIFSPDGNSLAIFSDKSDYVEIYLISAIDGREIDRLVKGHRTGDLESLHSYLSGIAFSPDGDKIAFVAKSKGKDALYFLTIDDKDIYRREYFDFTAILSPVWSPDGRKIAFSALNGDSRDLIIYDIESDSYINLINDDYDDIDPCWFPDSRRLAFSSDRPHPDNDFILKNGEIPAGDSLNWWAVYHKLDYGNYSLFAINTETGQTTPVDCGPGQNREPNVSPDGNKICFVSNRNGIDNLYITDIDSPTTFAITNLLTGAESPSWAPDGKSIAFSSFNKGGQDIYLITEIKAAGDNGVLEPTGYLLGEYNRFEPGEEEVPDEPDDESPVSIDSAITTLEAHTDFTEDPSGKVGPEMAAADDSTKAAIEPDAPEFEPAPIDITAKPTGETTDTESAAIPADNDSGAADTRIEDGEYVYVSDDDGDALGGLFDPVSDSGDGDLNYITPEEQAVFDSIASNNMLPSGEYKVYDYRVKFTPDFVSGGFSYDTFFGLRGQSVFAFSDYTGDHQILLVTDLVNTIDQSNIQLYYFYNRMKYNIGLGMFHTKNYYIDNQDHLFSDRLYGAQAYFALPFSKFTRAEFMASQFFIDRNFHDDDDLREKRSTKATVATLSLVQDNIIWGVTGPLNGRRSRINLSGAKDFFDNSNISFYSADFDYRKYWHLKGLFSVAFRLSGGASWGNNPKRYFLGGTSNYIGNTVVDARVYDEENLYFSDVITPMRGFEYYELSGTRYVLSNFEFRYPFVDYLKMNFPLPLTIGYVTGAMFMDLGATWQDDEAFKFGTSHGGDPRLKDVKSAFGFGIRANLGIFLLRYDLAWKTDFNRVSAHPKYYFSLGADF